MSSNPICFFLAPNSDSMSQLMVEKFGRNSRATTFQLWLSATSQFNRGKTISFWPRTAAAFVGDNPPDAVMITYYQRSRHLFGKLKLEVLDASGRVVDELPASKRPGLNRVTWAMREKPPRVPPAAQIAGSGTVGPRLVPGTYTVRLTKAGKVSEAKLKVSLDRRAKFNDADRKQQFDAAMRAHALFGEESALMDRILFLRTALAKSGTALAE